MGKVMCPQLLLIIKKLILIILFSLSKTQNYVRVVTLTAKDNQKLSKWLCKGFERLGNWNEYKTKSESINKTNEYRYFLE